MGSNRDYNSGSLRLDDAIQILEYVVSMREEKLGTENPEVDDEKRSFLYRQRLVC